MSYDDHIPERIAKRTIGGVCISTVICYSGFAERRMAETMIFIDGDPVPGLRDQECERCEISGARAMHDRWVAKVHTAVMAR